MARKILIVTALAQELDQKSVPSDCPVLYTGIGKINVAYHLMNELANFTPDLVVNFGTAGRLNTRLSGLLEVSSVIQRDMIAEPLAPRGKTPFDNSPECLYSGYPGVRCASGDSFVTASEDWLSQKEIEIVDMELFAIAAICHRKNISWRSFKYITDDANEESGKVWEESVHRGQELFIQKLDSLKI